jgi:hypothetical protein
MDDSPLTWVLILFPIGFLGIWCGVLQLLSLVSGWKTLARLYPAEVVPSDPTFRFQSAQFGLAGYNNCLNLTVSYASLCLVPVLPLRIGHAAICVPWRDIQVEPGRMFFARIGKLRFAKEPAITIRLRWSLLVRIAEASSGQLQLPPTPV